MWMYISLGVAILVLSYIFYPKSDRSFALVATTGLAISSVIGLGIVISRALPITRTEHVNKIVHTKYVKPPQVIYKTNTVEVLVTPGAEYEQVNTDAACKGSVPLIVAQVTKTVKDESAITWILATPVGKKYKITCRIPGSYDDFYTVGAIVTMPANGQNS